MKRMVCLMVALGFSSPLYAQSPPTIGDTLQNIPASSWSSSADVSNGSPYEKVTQPSPGIPPYAKTVSLAGPRFGLTMISDDTIRQLQEHDIEVRSPISQFGWQFEHEFYSKQEGPTVLNEWVLLLGGLDQGVAIPSLNWLVGLRTKDGTEFGIGPNVTPAGVALAIAAGITVRAGVINVPMTIAAVPSKYGTRISVLTGFTLRR